MEQALIKHEHKAGLVERLGRVIDRLTQKSRKVTLGLNQLNVQGCALVTKTMNIGAAMSDTATQDETVSAGKGALLVLF